MNKKKSSPKKVLFNSSIYSFTTLLQKGVNFILIPLYTIYLTPADYGVIGIVNSITQVLSLLFTLSLNSAVQRYYYKYNDNLEKLQKFYGTIITFVLLNSIVLSGLIITFRDILVEPFIEGIAFYPYIFLGIFTVVFNPIYTIYQSMLQTMEKAKVFSLNSILHFVLAVFLNVFLIVFLELGATGQLLSNLIVALIFGLYSLFSLYRSKLIKFGFDKKYMREALKYSLPLLPHLMSTNIANFVSRLFLNNQVSTAGAGLFNIASQFMTVIITVQTSVNNAYIPWFYSIMNEGKEQHSQVINFANIISKAYLIINLGMALFFKEIIQLFTPDSYLSAWMYIPILAVAYQIRSIYLFYVNTLFYNTKATRYIFIASVSGSILNLTITALFTSEIGLLTPAIATLIQQFFTTIIVIFMSRKIEPVDFNLKKLLGYVLLLIIVSFIGLNYDIRYPEGAITWENLLFKLTLFSIVGLVLIFKHIPDIKNILSSLIKKQ